MTNNATATATATVECRTCRGSALVNDIRAAAITHRTTTVRRICRPCKGTGEIQPLDATAAVRAMLWNQEIGDIPAWMLGEDDNADDLSAQ